jgi:predicted metal-binding membrane protein
LQSALKIELCNGTLLFVLGVMNLLWVAGIAVFVFAEKILPGGIWVGRVGAGVMLGFGVFLLTRV